MWGDRPYQWTDSDASRVTRLAVHSLKLALIAFFQTGLELARTRRRFHLKRYARHQWEIPVVARISLFPVVQPRRDNQRARVTTITSITNTAEVQFAEAMKRPSAMNTKASFSTGGRADRHIERLDVSAKALRLGRPQVRQQGTDSES